MSRCGLSNGQATCLGVVCGIGRWKRTHSSRVNWARGPNIHSGHVCHCPFREDRRPSLTTRRDQVYQTEWRLHAVENAGELDGTIGNREVIRGVEKQRDVEKDEIQKQTLRLVETSMLAATTGLAFFLSNNLRIEVNIKRIDP